MNLRQVTRAFRTNSRGTTAQGLNPEIEFIAFRALGLTSSQFALHGLVLPTYGVNVTIDAGLGNSFVIQATDSNAFQVDNPLNPPVLAPPIGITQPLQITIVNLSGGALGAITFDTDYRLAGAFPVLATPNTEQTVTFYFDLTTGLWKEQSRTAADVAAV